MEKELAAARADLQEAPSLQNYLSLAQVTLASITLFNIRRPGEASRLTLDTFSKRSKETNNDEITEHFSKVERELCKELAHVKVRGKRGRGVPMLLTKDMDDTLNLLVECRDVVGISSANPYIFTSGTSANAPPLRGSDCVRLLAKRAGAENITTAYRKRAATMLQLIVQLSETEMHVVAKFMGHDIRIHRSFYRLPEKTLNAAKVSKVLLAMQKGIGGFAGQTLEELDPGDEGSGDDNQAEGAREAEEDPREDEEDPCEAEEDPREAEEDTRECPSTTAERCGEPAHEKERQLTSDEMTEGRGGAEIRRARNKRHWSRSTKKRHATGRGDGLPTKKNRRSRESSSDSEDEEQKKSARKSTNRYFLKRKQI